MRSTLTMGVALLVCGLSVGCGGGTTSHNVSEDQLMSLFEANHMTVERLDETLMTEHQLSRLKVQPVQMIAANITDAHDQSAEVTLLEFRNEEEAIGVAGVSGMAARNWFVAGVLNQHMRSHIRHALQ
jgi:hypothetical protein